MKTFRVVILLTIGILLSNLVVAQNAELDSANYFFNTNQYEKALKIYRRFQDDKSLKRQSECLLHLGQVQPAKKILTALLNKDSSDVYVLSKLAYVYRYEYRYRQALLLYDKLISLDSTNSIYYKQRALLYEKINRIDKTIENYKQAIVFNPFDILAYSELTKIYLRKKQYAQAEEVINEGLKADNNNVELLLSLSKILYQQKNYPATIKTLSKITEIIPDTSLIMRKLLAFSYFNIGEYDTAAGLLEYIFAQDSGNESIAYCLGVSYRELGDEEKSIWYFQKAIENGISKNISKYYTHLAVEYEKNKQYAHAIKAYKAAYQTSKDKTLLYHLARNYDTYYKNKKTALMYYEIYLAQNDTENVDYQNYSKHRIRELKKTLHFELDTIE